MGHGCGDCRALGLGEGKWVWHGLAWLGLRGWGMLTDLGKATMQQPSGVVGCGWAVGLCQRREVGIGEGKGRRLGSSMART